MELLDNDSCSFYIVSFAKFCEYFLIADVRPNSHTHLMAYGGLDYLPCW